VRDKSAIEEKKNRRPSGKNRGAGKGPKRVQLTEDEREHDRERERKALYKNSEKQFPGGVKGAKSLGGGSKERKVLRGIVLRRNAICRKMGARMVTQEAKKVEEWNYYEQTSDPERCAGRRPAGSEGGHKVKALQ